VLLTELSGVTSWKAHIAQPCLHVRLLVDECVVDRTVGCRIMRPTALFARKIASWWVCCWQNCWVSRHEAAGRPKTEAPAAAAAAVAAADEERPVMSMMHRIASSPAITDRHGRHQSRASPAFVSNDELWKPGGRGTPHGRLPKSPADENILLGPPSRTMWQGGSAAGRRTPSVESNKQTRCLPCI